MVGILSNPFSRTYNKWVVKFIQEALNNYYHVKSNQRLSASKKSALTPACDLNHIDLLWREHERITGDLNSFQYSGCHQKNPKFSLLDLKIKLAREIFSECVFCEKQCQVNRNLESGFCGVKEPRIASLNYDPGSKPPSLALGGVDSVSLCDAGWEEELPLYPSHKVFFSGCNLNCVFCQNSDISQNPQIGIPITSLYLAKKIDESRMQGSGNVNLVGGDPTPNLPYILQTMKLTKENIPWVWNSNMYLSKESMMLLDGVIDLYLTDFKFGNDKCALRLSGALKYMEVVGRNHKMSLKSGNMIIRHLVLPNHLECCSIPLMDWIVKNLGDEVVLNIKGGYQPLHKSAGYEDISNPTGGCEVAEVVSYTRDLGIKNIITQS